MTKEEKIKFVELLLAELVEETSWNGDLTITLPGEISQWRHLGDEIDYWKSSSMRC